MNIERRIITGLIVSVEYLRRIHPIWRDDLIESSEMRRIANWCLSHFEQYQRAPDRDIEQIYLSKINEEGIPKAEGEFIEDILTSISHEYERGEQFNAAYLYDQTIKFFRESAVAQHADNLKDMVERGRLTEAEAAASKYQPINWITSRGLDVGTDQGYERIRLAFEKAAIPILTYPGALGDMLNRHLIRDGFVAFMGPEKRGKTYWLTDIACRALRQKCHVAFFQAGDMTESQYLRRLSVYLARRSDDLEYCAAHWRPVGDCVKNQFNLCRRSDRNCDHGVYDESEFEEYKEEPNNFQCLSALSEIAKSNPDYSPCDSASCNERWASVWLSLVPEKEPLTGIEAARITKSFFDRWRKRFRLVTYPNGTLTVDEMRDCLAEWESQDDFTPDVIVVDYADLMADGEREFRHRQNEIWKGLRAISQERRALVVTATQTDADSYRSSLLKLSNFSEDKRKYGHVTAMWGLNQDTQNREKELGVMRINTILAREGKFNMTDAVHVLQDLSAGRPFMESFWGSTHYRGEVS